MTARKTSKKAGAGKKVSKTGTKTKKKPVAKKKPASRAKPKKATVAKKPVGKAKASKPKAPPRAPNNPYKASSGYSQIYDLLHAAGVKGITRSALVEKFSRLSGKSPQLASFSVSVVTSRKAPDDIGHKSLKGTAWVERTGDNLVLRSSP